MSVVDPETIESVNTLFSKTSAYSANYRIVRLDEVRILWGQAALKSSDAKILPNKFEQRVIRVVNCDPNKSKPFSKKIRVETKRGFSVDITKTVVASQEFKMGISLSLGDYGKVNADLIARNSIETTKKESQSFSETVTIDYDESFDAGPLTDYEYTYTAVKGLLSVPIEGRVIVDALFLMRRTDLPLQGMFWLSDPKLLPTPQDRMIDFKGNLINEGYERIDIKHNPHPIRPDDPVCRSIDELADSDGAIFVASSTFIGNG